MRKLIFLLLFITSSVQAQTYWQSTIISGLNRPVAFDFAPDGRIFLTLKGEITGPATDARILVYSSTGNFISTFYDLTDSTDGDFERGLIGIALDPDFVNNHFVYAFYVHLYAGDERLRIVRFTENNNTGTNPFLVFDLDVPENLPGVHIAGNIHFRPSEPSKIYFTLGDIGSDQTDTAANYAHMLSNPFGKTLRINSNGSIPTDNPFYDDGNILTGNCDLIWSYGHRNPFDFCFSPVNDSMYCTENGLITWDELNLIHRGKNYGWNTCEGFYLNSSTTQFCTDTNSVLPMDDWAAPLPAVTGILFYSDTTMPEFNNHLLVADNDNGFIYDLTLGNPPYYDTVISNQFWIDATTNAGLTTIRKGSDGCVYALNGGYSANADLYRICPSWMGTGEIQPDPLSLVQAFPNPFTGNSTIQYSLAKEMNVQIILYDCFGRKMALLSEEKENKGLHEIFIDTNKLQLAQGNYLCRIQAGNSVKTLILSVQ